MIWFTILMPKSDISKNFKVNANNKIPAKEKQIENKTPFKMLKTTFFSLKIEIFKDHLLNKKTPYIFV